MKISSLACKIRGWIPANREGFEAFGEWGCSEGYLVQDKLDGWHCTVIKVDNKTNIYTGEEPRVNQQLQPTIDALNAWLPDDSIVFGELGFGTEAETRWATEHGFHRFIAFDVIRWNGEDVSGMSTLARFGMLTLNLRYSYPDDTGILQLVRSSYFKGEEDIVREGAWGALLAVIKEGGEGLIIKRADLPYVGGGEHKYFYKVKKYLTRDFICMRFTESTAATYVRAGMPVAAMVYGVLEDGVLVETGAVSGFPFDMRKAFYERPADFIGRVVEVGGFELFKGGAMRHPMIMRFRDDKKPEECTFESLFKEAANVNG